MTSRFTYSILTLSHKRLLETFGTKWRRRTRHGADMKTRRRRKLRLESLELRQVLSSAPPTIAISDATSIEGSAVTKYLDTLVAPASGGLQNARGFDFGPDGNIYVSAERHWEDPIQLGWVNRYDGVTGRFLGVFASHPSMTGAKDVEFGPDGNLYVPNNVGDDIYRFDGQTGAFLDVFVPTGLGGLDTPRSIIFGPDASGDGVSDAYVSSANTDSILRYDTVTGAFLGAFVSTGSGGLNDPTAIVFGPDGDLYVASGAHSDFNNSILRYDGVTGAFKGVFVAAGSAGLTLAPTAGVIFGRDVNNDGAQDMYVSNGVPDEILVYNGTTGAFLQKYITPGLGGLNDPKGLRYGDGNLLVISNYDSILRFGPSSQAVFTVSLSAASETPVAVDYATADGTASASDDYAPVAGTIVFQPGETTRTILVATSDNAAYESNESFSLLLSNSSGATILDGQGVATIADNDPPPTKFYVVDDNFLNRTFEYQASGSLVENYGLGSGNSAPRGAASTITGDKVWVVDANRRVYVYNNSGGLLGSWTAGTLASNATVEGIATNGTDVWIVDARADRVYRYLGAASRTSGSQNAASNFTLNSGNTSPKDIVTNGTHLWVVNDSSTNRVFKYTVAGQLVGSWTISGANTTPTGITIDPANVSDIWIVDSGTDRVYQYAGAAGRTSGSQSPVASFALASGNSNPQGIADPPATLGAVESRPNAIALPPSSNLYSRQVTSKPRPRVSIASQAASFENLNFLARTNRDTQPTIGNGKKWEDHTTFSQSVAVDAALEEMDFSAWPELLNKI
jgi:hypothetical protein